MTSDLRRTGTRIALAIALSASAAACAHKAPPPPPPPEAPPPPPPNPPMEGAPSGPVSSAPIPGSLQDFVVNAGDRVYFGFNQDQVSSEGQGVLSAQAQWLARYPRVTVRIEGNTDPRGTREYNLALGARRAEAVKNYLVTQGVSPARITTISFGKERPIDPGTDDAAYAKDRNAHTAIVGGAVGGGASSDFGGSGSGSVGPQ